MSKNKLFYESPLAEAFVVRIERPLMSDTASGAAGWKDTDRKARVITDYEDENWW